MLIQKCHSQDLRDINPKQAFLADLPDKLDHTGTEPIIGVEIVEHPHLVPTFPAEVDKVVVDNLSNHS